MGIAVVELLQAAAKAAWAHCYWVAPGLAAPVESPPILLPSPNQTCSHAVAFAREPLPLTFMDCQPIDRWDGCLELRPGGVLYRSVAGIQAAFMRLVSHSNESLLRGPGTPEGTGT